MAFFFQLLQPPTESIALNPRRPQGHTKQYQHGKYKPQLIALAEGLHAIGAETASNINYYRESVDGEWLLKRKKFNPAQVRCVLIGLECLLPTMAHQTKQLLQTARKAKIPIVLFDWIANWILKLPPDQLQSRVLQNVDRCMYYSYSTSRVLCVREPKFQPWPIGMTQRVIDECARSAKPFNERRSGVLWCHRLLHALRKQVWEQFYQHAEFPVHKYHDEFQRPTSQSHTEYDRLMNYQTGNRHHPEFYAALGNAQLVDCCGGFLRDGIITQWDSYKLWEAFAAGCCVITFDLQHYGLLTGATTEEPISGVHYIGLRLDGTDLKRTIETSDLEAIARRGKNWALENFSPVSRAKKFQDVVVAI